MAELTVAQIAARMGISERTARRWIETGTIKTEPGRRRGYYRVDLHELEQKARNDPDELTALRAEVAALSRRVEELERQVQEGPARPKARMLRPVRSYYHVDQDDQEGDLTPARTFAEAHGFTRDLMAGWIKRGEIQTTPVSPGTKGQTQHKLTPGQEQAVIAFWERAGLVYERCPRCPHEPQSGPLHLS